MHLTNVHARESFRHRSLLADIADGVVTGLGPDGYAVALRALVARRVDLHDALWVAAPTYMPPATEDGSGG